MNAVIVVDCQKDFSDFGTIYLEGALEVVSNIKRFLCNLDKTKWKIIFSKDWHPHNHISFTKFPMHCIKYTIGAQYHDELKDLKKDYEIKKGTRKKVDSFSAFFKNNEKHSKLNVFLQKNKVTKVYICGFVKDICVLQTALDSLKFGYETFIIDDLTIALNEEEYYIKRNPLIKEIDSKDII